MTQEAKEGKRLFTLIEFLRAVTSLGARYPVATLSFCCLLALSCIIFSACCLKFKTNRADLIDPQATFHRRWLNYTESFGDTSDIVVVVENENPESIKRILEELGSKMLQEPELFRDVLYKIEPGQLAQKGLQYLSPEQLEHGLERLGNFTPILQGRWDLVRLQPFLSLIRLQLLSRSNSSLPVDELLQQTNLLADSLQQFLVDQNEFRSPWPELMSVDRSLKDEADEVIYLLNDQGNMGFVKAFPLGAEDDFNGASKSIDRLREIVAEVSARYPGSNIGMTGIPVLENDEMRRSQADMIKASLLSFMGVGLLLLLGFRGVRHPMLALATLLVAMCWAFGYTTLAIGHLNILSISFAAILIGLGIDFSIHYLARYLQLRHEGRLLRPALLDTSSSVGTGIVTAAITTALAFFCATFTQFLGVAELGLIAGGGILLCGVATFLVLPALLMISDRQATPLELPTPFQGSLLREAVRKFPKLITAFSGLFILWIGFRVVSFENGEFNIAIRYDHNLLNLQAEGLESVVVQKHVFDSSKNSLLYAVSVAQSPQEARELKTRFEKQPRIHHVETLASRFPDHGPEETQLMVQAFGAHLQKLPESLPQFSQIDPGRIGEEIEQLLNTIAELDNPQVIKIAPKLNSFLDQLENHTLDEQILLLTQYESRMLATLLTQFHALKTASDPDPVSLSDFPKELTSRFVSPTGHWLLQIYPEQEIWEVEPLREFVQQVREIDPEATGTPLQNFESARQIRDSYQRAAWYALAVISTVLLIDFLEKQKVFTVFLPPLFIVGITALLLQQLGIKPSGAFLTVSFVAMAMIIAAWFDFESVRNTVLALFPPLAGGLIMFGCLNYLGVDFNPANLIVLPLVLGIGVDDGVHVIHDFKHQADNYQTSPSTINAIVLTSLTSMIGFGSMMIAAHRGLYSVGLVLVIGVGSCLFVSLVALPALLTIISTMPKSASDLLLSTPDSQSNDVHPAQNYENTTTDPEAA